ncbi:DEAD-domain-containing protein [Viridothelium virens]|uniref:ATP-dependent RNA helicase n=1 Tax=Viridothelium virens TaxID=1048519 RepID=A0A6A6HLE3_VIRVR|nr:DEAD-domain-containing protein [Viridothelium virens]
MSRTLNGRSKIARLKKQKSLRTKHTAEENVHRLEEAVTALDTKTAELKLFKDLPLSEPTRFGLKAGHFSTLTDIQAKAIPLGLKGSDILGAAKTGSGKTLAFLVPVLENLYRSQCIGADAGLGAMIISPTRELAIQIFDVLFKIGRKGHMFAAGLIIGGKSVQEEQQALARMNIVVCTPGRILQHLSQTASFSIDALQMLVLDEADRIMDMGFQRDVDAIIEYLPKSRQTLLFSATQTKKVSDLARLSLKDPEYVSVHETATSATPSTLQQNYIVTPLSEKLNTLWSFLCSSKKSKILVFLSSGKQVRFVYECFRRMQPGIPLLHLHGRQKQTARLDITTRFSQAQYCCLFATDVVARGLDFPAVDWVIQADCPEDADTYIHRVGRTARFERDGKAVLFLEPSEEEGMLERLEHKKIPIERINVRAKKQQDIKNQLQNMAFKDPQLKYLGQKAFISYVKSIYLQKDKEVFHMDDLPLEDFAESLGLPGAPRIRFGKGDNAKELKNAPRTAVLSSDEEGERPNDEDDNYNERKGSQRNNQTVRTKYDRMFERQNQDVLAPHYARVLEDTHGEDRTRKDEGNIGEDDDLFSVKRIIPAEGTVPGDSDKDGQGPKKVMIPGMKEPLVLDSKRREKLLRSKKKLSKLKEKGTKLVFDDNGKARPVYELEDETKFAAKGLPEEQRKLFLDEEKKRIELADLDDKAAAKEKRRVKKEKKRAREQADMDDGDGADGVELLNPDENAFANFLADAEAMDEPDEREQSAEPPPKRRKWFEDEPGESGKASQKRAPDYVQPETLEDLEALAAGVLE